MRAGRLGPDLDERLAGRTRRDRPSRRPTVVDVPRQRPWAGSRSPRRSRTRRPGGNVARPVAALAGDRDGHVSGSSARSRDTDLTSVSAPASVGLALGLGWSGSLGSRRGVGVGVGVGLGVGAAASASGSAAAVGDRRRRRAAGVAVGATTASQPARTRRSPRAEPHDRGRAERLARGGAIVRPRPDSTLPGQTPLTKRVDYTWSPRRTRTAA